MAKYRAALGLFALVFANIGWWWWVETQGGSENYTNLLTHGAIRSDLLRAGEWWRLFSAIFLHIGAKHLIGNMGLLMILGLLFVQTWATWQLWLTYVFTGVLGNVAGFMFGSAVSLKAGASGAILGLLGAFAGARIGAIRRGAVTRYKSWHVIAMLVAFYGLVVGVNPESDHVAHVGGLVSGLVLGFLFERGRPTPIDYDPQMQALESEPAPH